LTLAKSAGRLRLKKPFAGEDINAKKFEGVTMFSTFRTTAIGAAALALAQFASPAQAAYTVTLQEVPAGGGSTNVVASGSGSIDLTDLHLAVTGVDLEGATVTPNFGLIVVGPRAINTGVR